MKIYILGRITQHTLGATFRVDYNISIHYYGSPFASVVKYSEFKRVTTSTVSGYYDSVMFLNPILNGTSYEGTCQNSQDISYSFGNSNFNFYQSDQILYLEGNICATVSLI